MSDQHIPSGAKMCPLCRKPSLNTDSICKNCGYVYEVSLPPKRQTKDCPRCHTQVTEHVRSCPNCLYDFNTQFVSANSSITRSTPSSAAELPFLSQPSLISQPIQPSLSTVVRKPVSLACVYCGGENTLKVSAAYQAGISSGVTTGISVGGGHVQGGPSFTTVNRTTSLSSNSTGLANVLTPPKKPIMQQPIGFLGASCMGLGAFFAGIGLLGAMSKGSSNSDDAGYDDGDGNFFSSMRCGSDIHLSQSKVRE